MNLLAVLTASILLSTTVTVAAQDGSQSTLCCDVDVAPAMDSSAKLLWDKSFPPRRSVATGVQEYPKVAKRLGEQGRVLVEFRVSHDGTPVDIRIARSSENARLDDQALRILRGTLFAKPRGFRPTKVFRETVAFCIGQCAPAARFVDSQGVLLVTTAAPPRG